jgi:hypothetical protein
MEPLSRSRLELKKHEEMSYARAWLKKMLDAV